MIRLLDASPAHHAAILRLNTGAVPNVNLISEAGLRSLHRESCYLRVAMTDDGVSGFLLALPEGARYDSANYRWFTERYPSFVYIDRIVVDPQTRRQGLGRLLYSDLEGVARLRAPILACEVNLRPPNPGSMRFHEGFGFEEAGEQDTEGGAKRVRLMTKRIRKP